MPSEGELTALAPSDLPPPALYLPRPPLRSLLCSELLSAPPHPVHTCGCREEIEQYDAFDEGVYCRARFWLLSAYVVSVGAIIGSVLVMLHYYSLPDGEQGSMSWFICLAEVLVADLPAAVFSLQKVSSCLLAMLSF